MVDDRRPHEEVDAAVGGIKDALPVLRCPRLHLTLALSVLRGGTTSRRSNGGAGPMRGGRIHSTTAELVRHHVKPLVTRHGAPGQTGVCRRDRSAAHLTEALARAGVLGPSDAVTQWLGEWRWRTGREAGGGGRDEVALLLARRTGEIDHDGIGTGQPARSWRPP